MHIANVSAAVAIAAAMNFGAAPSHTEGVAATGAIVSPTVDSRADDPIGDHASACDLPGVLANPGTALICVVTGSSSF
ncbi:hypothetical protein [Nocardia anaemiae]|uniref:hypothetical protein n=1 Tax=Nocardia anaemiae TaxID=263910 RepID=UPI0007A378E9|nr:hypothetical protein [Nocardia anaemiae]